MLVREALSVCCFCISLTSDEILSAHRSQRGASSSGCLRGGTHAPHTRRLSSCPARDAGKRNIANSGTVSIPFEAEDLLEVRLSKEGQAAEWQKLTGTRAEKSFSASLEVPAGGWYQLAVRLTRGGKVLSTIEVEHVGVGEIFVVAGQSNSANHGEKKLVTRIKRVVNFDGQRWQLANDPQPGASGKGGSFIPALGDALVERWDVPVAFVTCGIGATSVREWLPAGRRFPIRRRSKAGSKNGPTASGLAKATHTPCSSNEPRPLAQGISRGALASGRKRCESKRCNAHTARQTLPRVPGKADLRFAPRPRVGSAVVRGSSQLSSPGDTESAEIRDAQASLWKDNIALQGPDSDALRGDLRERNGAGVHFSEKG